MRNTNIKFGEPTFNPGTTMVDVGVELPVVVLGKHPQPVPPYPPTPVPPGPGPIPPIPPEPFPPFPIQGIQGLQGFTGAQGISGLPGHMGPRGLQGVKGDAGNGFIISGYVSIVDNLPEITDLYTVWLVASVSIYLYVGEGLGDTDTPASAWRSCGTVGEKGEDGLQGVQGTQGVQGFLGLQGVQGTQGIQGLLGIQGLTGLQGCKGHIGPMGHPFRISRSYDSVVDMDKHYADPNIFYGDMALVNTPDDTDSDDGKIYYKGLNSWEFISRLANAVIQGPPGRPGEPIKVFTSMSDAINWVTQHQGCVCDPGHSYPGQILTVYDTTGTAAIFIVDYKYDLVGVKTDYAREIALQTQIDVHGNFYQYVDFTTGTRPHVRILVYPTTEEMNNDEDLFNSYSLDPSSTLLEATADIEYLVRSDSNGNSNYMKITMATKRAGIIYIN